MDIGIHELLNIVEIIIIIGAADCLAPSIITPSKLGGPFMSFYEPVPLFLLLASRRIVDYEALVCVILYPMSTFGDLLRFETNEGPIVRLAKAYCSTGKNILVSISSGN